MSRFHESNRIHPTAIIGSKVQIGRHNTIEAHCVLEGDLQLGNYNHLRVGVVTTYRVQLGDHNHIFPYVTLGFQGEMGAKGDLLPEDGRVIIGDGNTLREYTNVHAPRWYPATYIGNRNYIMNKVYLAHDVQVGDGVMITAGALLGGRAEVESYANLGLGCTIHQRSVVGESAMVGMQASVKAHVPPFAVVAGVPARISKFNAVGARRRDFDPALLEDWTLHYTRRLQQQSFPDDPIGRSLKRFFTRREGVLQKLREG